MQVILLRSMPRLGVSGSIVEVKDGYARNCLIPRDIAMPATRANIAQHKASEQEHKAKLEQSAKLFDEVANCLRDKVVCFAENASDDGKLFGSVKVRRIAQALDQMLKASNGPAFNIDPHEVELTRPIKEHGLFHARYGTSEQFRFFVAVARTEDEARSLHQEQDANHEVYQG